MGRSPTRHRRADGGYNRDLLAAEVQCFGWNLQLIDPAGLRQTEDDLERAGQDLLHGARQQADLILFCCPFGANPGELGSQEGDVILWTKVDLAESELDESKLAQGLYWGAIPYVSAELSGKYFEVLVTYILHRLGLPIV